MNISYIKKTFRKYISQYIVPNKLKNTFCDIQMQNKKLRF